MFFELSCNDDPRPTWSRIAFWCWCCCYCYMNESTFIWLELHDVNPLPIIEGCCWESLRCSWFLVWLHCWINYWSFPSCVHGTCLLSNSELFLYWFADPCLKIDTCYICPLLEFTKYCLLYSENCYFSSFSPRFSFYGLLTGFCCYWRRANFSLASCSAVLTSAFFLV